MRITGDRVLVMPCEETEKVTSGGIVLPDNSEGEPVQKGVVMAVGPGRRSTRPYVDYSKAMDTYGGSDTTEYVQHEEFFIPMMVKIGDTVIYPKHAGMEIQVDKDKCLVMREMDIIAVVSSDDDGV